MAALLLGVLAGPAFGQIDAQVAALEQAGWKAIATGQPESAATAFRDAIGRNPRNPRLHLGAAVAAYVQRRDEEARSALDRALALDPKMREARELLGQVLYRGGDLNGAILVFDGLVGERDAPGAAGTTALAETLDRWRREADLRDRMHLTVGSGFTVAFEGPDDAELAARALASIELAAARIGALLSHYPIRPIPVVLYTNEQFRDVTRAPAWAGGAFDGTVRIPMRGALANAAELDRVLAHEYVHALVLDLAKSAVPAWLNEGLAVALERPDPPRPLADAAGKRVPLRALRASFGRFTGGQAARAYATSGAAVQRMLDDVGGFAVMLLLRDLGEGVDFDAAFTHRMQRSIADFEASLDPR